MPEQPIGSDSPYLAPNESGVGAVFFDKPSKDLLSIHLNNLEGVDKALGEKKEQQKQARAVATKLLEYKNPDTNGIFPKDSEEINKKGQEVTQAMTDLLRLGKQDPSNPEWVSAYNNLNNKKQELLTGIGASKAFNQKINQIGAKMAAGELKNADAVYWAKNHTDALKLSLAERIQHPIYGDPVQWIRDKAPDLDEAVNAYIKQTNPKGVTIETTELGDGGNAYYKRKTTENITPEQIKEVAHGFRTMENLAPAFEQRWQALQEKSPETVKALRDKYKDLDPIAREQKAQEDYVEGLLTRGHYTKSTEFVFDKLSEQGRKALIAFSKSTPNAKDVSFGDAANIADFWNGKPGSDKAFKQIPLANSTYKARLTVDDGFGNKKEIVAPIENVIIDAGYENGKPYVVTSESKDPQSEINGGNVANGGKIFFASPRALTSYIFGKNASKVEKAFSAAGAVTPDKDYDTQKFAPVSKWQNKPTGTPDVTVKQEPSWFDKNKQTGQPAKEVKLTYTFKGKDGKNRQIDISSTEEKDFLKSHPDAKKK